LSEDSDSEMSDESSDSDDDDNDQQINVVVNQTLFVHDFSISTPWLTPIDGGGLQSSSLTFSNNVENQDKKFVSISRWDKKKRSWQIIKDCHCHQYFSQNLSFTGGKCESEIFYVYASLNFCSC